MMTLLKIILFLATFLSIELIGRNYKKKNITEEKGNNFLYESQSLIYWYQGAKETKAYWGFWVPALLFTLLLLSLS